MPTYEVSQTHFFRENGQRVEAGGTTELSEEAAEAHNKRHPGLLKPVRQTTQRRVSAVRKTVEKVRKPRSRAKK